MSGYVISPVRVSAAGSLYGVSGERRIERVREVERRVEGVDEQEKGRSLDLRG